MSQAALKIEPAPSQAPSSAPRTSTGPQADGGYIIAAEDKVPFSQNFYYAITGIAIIPGMQVVDRIAQVVLNLGLGWAPTFIGGLLAAFRIWDAFTDPYFGNLSDNYRSRWGRRRPFMVLGGVLCAASFPLLWLMSPGWEQPTQVAFFVGAGLLYYTSLTIYTVPYFSLAAEMTPDTHERTNVVAFRTFIWTLVTAPLNYLPWFVNHSAFGGNQLLAMRWLSVGVALAFLVFGILPILKVKEPFYEVATKQPPTPLAESFLVTVKNPLFLVLVGMKLLMTLGMQTVGTLGFYVAAFYACRGDLEEAGLIAGTGGLIGMGLAAASVPLCAWLSKRFGKILSLYFFGLFFLAATLSQWWLVTPEHPRWMMISAAMIGPVVTAIWVILPSMQTDVIDADELATGKRREGSFSAIMGWIEKLGFALSVFLGGAILDFAGFDHELKQQLPETLTRMRQLFVFYPIGMASLMLLLIPFYPLNEKRCQEIRQQLEERRGKPQVESWAL